VTIIGTDATQYSRRIDQFLEIVLSNSDVYQPLQAAMRYSVLTGGKRFRPLLIYTMGDILELPPEKLDHAACSVELVHAYSLIHDDLPIMDNDDWRRGNPSCHKRFGEAIALLAGNALQALAFATILKAPLSPLQILTMLGVLTKAVGNMLDGQAMEFARPAVPIDFSAKETINLLKTGSLFCAALEFVGLIANVSPQIMNSLSRLGYALGQSYQLYDDICDNQANFQDLAEAKAKSKGHLLDSFEKLRTLLPPLPEQFLIHLFPQLCL